MFVCFFFIVVVLVHRTFNEIVNKTDFWFFMDHTVILENYNMWPSLRVACNDDLRWRSNSESSRCSNHGNFGRLSKTTIRNALHGA